MFAKPRPKTKLEIEIDKLVLALGDHEPNSDEYGQIIERLTKLNKVAVEKQPPRVSPDVVAKSVAHLIGIALIIRHENLNVITSKALSLVPKP